jgi:hypothetical protein
MVASHFKENGPFLFLFQRIVSKPLADETKTAKTSILAQNKGLHYSGKDKFRQIICTAHGKKKI